MQTLTRPSLFALVLVTLVAGAFVGLAAAHDSGGANTHEDCEMNQRADDRSMVEGRMQMGEDCSMTDGEGMMGMHDDSLHNHDCPMH